MKKLVLLALACGMYASASTQNDLEPCCSVIKINAAKNLITVRDKTSGRLYQFKADNMDMRSVQTGDAVSFAANKVSAINGSARTYPTVRPDYVEPCCSVVRVQVDGLEPCCADVTIQNNFTNKSFLINVPKQIAKGLKTGGPVSYDSLTNFAIIELSFGGIGGELNTYGYAVSALNDNKNGSEPCCSILALNTASGTTLVRDQTTGRLYLFKADNMDMRSLKKGDAVTISTNKISAINGSTRTYATFKPDYAEPCCAVVSVQIDGAEPCCNAVTVSNHLTNKIVTLSIPKQVAATIKAGHAVSIDADNNLAVVQSPYGSSNGEMNSFGYPATSEDGVAANENATDKWVITPVTSMKGVLGRLESDFPSGLDWVGNLAITQQSDKKYITSLSGEKMNTVKFYDIAPGEYLIHLNHIPVESVPVHKGYKTRLKAGVLNIVSEGRWEIYDESKDKYLTSNNKPMKFVIPVGSYQLKLGDQFYPVIIKDGVMVEY
jgi:hypothetical protein